ncbi:hypothetical protein C6W92_16565 [Roseovarius sp. A46]|nr:hypothetical protein C6W92_16565 [Roseovarius sp. A46]
MRRGLQYQLQHLIDRCSPSDTLLSCSTTTATISCAHICKIWFSEPDRFILDPIHEMAGLNT